MNILCRILFSVMLSVCLLIFAVHADNDGHSWSNAVFTWTNDNTAAAVTLQCAECGELRSDTAIVSLEAYTDATCMNEGAVSRIATVFTDGTLYSDRKSTVIPKRPHSYTTPTFTWNLTSMTCQASWSCTVGGESEILECTVTTPTDSPAGDTAVYTASVTVGSIIYTDTKAVPITPVGHSYSTPEIRWSDDLLSATAFSVCAHCSDSDPEKVLSVPCRVTSLTVPATCSADGHTVYTARADLLGTSLEETKTVILPRRDHSYSIPTFHWENDMCDAYYTCLVDGAVFITGCDVRKQQLWEDCTAPGVCTLTAEISIGGVIYTDSRQAVLPAKGHTEKRIVGKTATCTEDGLTDGIVCADCNHTILEQTALIAAGHTPMTVQDGAAPTCTEDGIADRIVCTVCTESLQEADILPALGHSFEEAVFSWSTIGDSVSASKSCIHGCGTVQHGTVTLTTNKEIQNGITVTTVLATAVFDDGSTASASKTVGSNADPADPIPPPLRFVDVASGSYYKDAVAWAAAVGITQGTSADHFSPDMDCSRAQIVTMLWRAAGSPMTDSTAAFTDVAATAYYYHAVVWASETGITAGTSQTTFSPDMPCSRAQIVTMLWRAAGCPKPVSAVPFTDVTADAWYADAVAWAVENGITQGTGDNIFSPDAVCTRAQIVTFLYRSYKKN